jgi:ribonucleoside-diphosphate reductase alpha chain
MKVITRSGNKEDVRFDLITDKLKNLSEENDILGKKLNVDPVFIAQNICSLIYDGITTSELDDFSANFSATLFKNDPDYLILASRIAVNNHHKNTNEDFFEVMKTLNEKGIISDKFIEGIKPDKTSINNLINYGRDYSISYFGFKTLQNAYLLKAENVVLERPQHLFMRVALSIHMGNLVI